MSKPNFLYAVLSLATFACGGDDGGGMIDPTDVRFGDTALIVVVNPAINDGNRHTVPVPGSTRSGIVIRSDDGLSDTTDADGIAVIGPLTSGLRTFEVSGNGVDGTFTLMLAAGALREIALAADGARAEVMVDLDYK